jgi:hypothetical protein
VIVVLRRMTFADYGPRDFCQRCATAAMAKLTKLAAGRRVIGEPQRQGPALPLELEP